MFSVRGPKLKYFVFVMALIAIAGGVYMTFFESKGYVTRERSKEDERVLVVTLTEKGEALKEQALSIPSGVGGCIRLDSNEAATLYKLLYKLLQNIDGSEEE